MLSKKNIRNNSNNKTLKKNINNLNNQQIGGENIMYFNNIEVINDGCITGGIKNLIANMNNNLELYIINKLSVSVPPVVAQHAENAEPVDAESVVAESVAAEPPVHQPVAEPPVAAESVVAEPVDDEPTAAVKSARANIANTPSISKRIENLKK